ncbi:MAG: hypothetical protein ACI4WX_01335 [Aristaeellaceae bacterium]
MKKLLAWLLAFMLPCCVLAETSAVTLEVSADGKLFPAYAAEVLQRLPGMTAEAREAYTQLLHALLKDTKLTAAVQDDAASVDIMLSGNTLLDVVVHDTANISYLTTSLLPGYTLAEVQADTQLQKNGPSQLDEAALNAMADSVVTAVTDWSKALKPAVSYGAFEGDAYTGGTKCTTWVLSDQDIAALVSAVATEEVRAAVIQLLRGSGADAMQLLQRFDALNEQVAKVNAYEYILRMAHDGEDQFVGLSLAILSGVEQVATVSFGNQEGELRLVIGLGLQNQNFWREYVAAVHQDETGTAFSIIRREWVADKAFSFSSVNATHAPVNTSTWNAHFSQSGEQYLWDAALYEGVTVDEGKKLASCTGSFSPADKSMEVVWSLHSLAGTALKVRFSVNPTQEIPPLDPSLVICSDNNPADAALYAQLNQMIIQALTKRLLTLLPLDVLLNFGDLFPF